MQSFSFLQGSFRLWSVVGLGVLLAGCGGGSSDSGSLAGDSLLEQTMDFGGLTTRIAGTIQTPVTSGGSGATVTGVAGATINSLTMKLSPSATDLTNAKIAFYDFRDGNAEIYTMNPDGSGLSRITFDPATDAQPAWSPDGTKIAFVSNRSGNFDVWVMNSDGSNPQNLTANSSVTDSGPSWSPDGKKIVFHSYRTGNNANIFIMNADGSNVTPALTTSTDAEEHPIWSLTGNKIVYQRNVNGNNWEVFTMNTDGTNQVNRTNNSSGDFYPSWSPDGKKIIFNSDRSSQASGDTDLYSMNADGTALVALTANAFADSDAYWSPNGSKIVFTRFANGVESILTMDAAGSNQTSIYTTPSDANFARWSWAPLASRNLIGTGGTLGSVAAGFLFGQSGAAISSLLAFDSEAAIRQNARVATTTGIASGLSNYLFTLTHTKYFTSLSFTNDLTVAPTVVIGADAPVTQASSVLVSYEAATGKVAAVLPYDATRAAQPAATEANNVVTLRGKFLGAWDGNGKNLAPNGATELHLDARTGALTLAK